MAPVQFEQHSEADMDHFAAASDESTDEELQLRRTQSQAMKQQRVQQILQRLSERRAPVRELVTGLEDGELTEVEQKQKVARNLGEDLLEDMLALDALSGLYDEDRQARKAALADIEVLTDQVDGAKAQLQKRRKVLQAKQEEADAVEKAQLAEKQAAAEQAKLEAAQEEELCEDLPAPENWAKLKLPMRFYSRAVPDGWVASAELPSGCTSKDLQMEIEGRTLRISGFRLPTTQDLEVLNEEAQRLLRGRRPTEPQDYLQLGRGMFGRVDEALQLPEDVDIQGISASCRGGVLQLILPRQLRAPRAPLSSFRGRRAPLYGW